MDRNSEKDYLTRISKDLQLDTANFSWTVRELKKKEKYLGELLQLIQQDQIDSADSTTVIKYIVFGTYLAIGHPPVANGTFEELKNTGAMRYVTNTDLRTEINNYYFKRDHHDDRIEKRRLESKYNALVNNRIPGIKNIMGKIGYRHDLVPYRNVLEMIKEADFINNTISEYNNTLFMLDRQIGGLTASTDLLQRIVEELKE